MEASAVLIAVSKELAKQAQDSLPELLDGERVKRCSMVRLFSASTISGNECAAGWR